MKKAQWTKYSLRFKFEARTSRQVMTSKDTYFIRVYDTEAPDRTVGIGECALFKELSADDVADYETVLSQACKSPEEALALPYSSIRFGFETALNTPTASEWQKGKAGIPINGLIWMGDKKLMAERIAEKLDSGFSVLKLKIGGINFDDELDLLRNIRNTFSAGALEIRLDANGSFTPDNALERLNRLAPFGIHSLEQPLRAGMIEQSARICAESPIDIALDEELIGCRTYSESLELLEAIKPQYIILKPSLCGGFAASDTYIDIAHKLNMGWWATSALESDIGLYAIASWLAPKGVVMPQGLGTGKLYYNNVESPLYMKDGALWSAGASTPVLPEGLEWND